MFCWHKWDIMQRDQYRVTSSGVQIGTKYVFILRCSKCGDVKVTKKTV